MMLLLIGLGSLTNVNLQMANSDQAQRIAKENARLGVLLALAQLQAAAGPDTRVTATGDLVGQTGDKAFWTGVWRTGNGEIERWLVSNNGVFADSAAGSVGAGTAVAADSVEFLSFLAEEGRVRVPRVTLSDAGGYAWWVGDEGTKARINALDPYRDMAEDPEEEASGPDKEARSRYRLLVAQETGSALLLGAANVDRAIDPADAAQRGKVANLATLEQISLLEQGEEESVLNRKDLFHDVTLSSRSVLADVRNGGLKRDLTGLFESGASAPANFPPAWWSRLRDYYNSAGKTSLDAVVDTNADAQNIFPVLVKANFLIPMFRGAPEPVNAMLAGDQQGHQVYVGLSLSFSLHNPYNVELKLPAGFFVELILPAEADLAEDTDNTVRHFRIASRNNRDGSPRSESELSDRLLASGVSRFHVRLEMDEPVTFEPGQTLLFSIANGGSNLDVSGSANAEVVAKLKNDVRMPLDYLYKHIAVNEGDAYKGLYGVPTLAQAQPGASGSGGEDSSKGMLQAADIILELDTAPDLFVQMRVGLPGTGVNAEPLWFSGFRSKLDVHGSLPEHYRLDSRADYNGMELTRPDGPSSPNGGFGLSFEMPMSRRESVFGGTALRPLVDFNMRGVPEAWNDPLAPQVEVDGYYARVFTRNAVGMADGTPLKWFFHDLDVRLSALRPYGVLIPGYMQSSNAPVRVGWAGPSPFGADKATLPSARRDPDIGTVYFDIPAQKPLSLGALRHAQVFDSRYAPAYSVGTSWAPAFPATVRLDQEDDLYKLNRLLWDSYFFSSFTSEFRTSLGGGADYTDLPALPNSRLGYCFSEALTAQQRQSVLANPQTAASQLMVEGGFNVNSTSVAAWRALLASLRDTLSDYRESDKVLGTPFSRYNRTLLDKKDGAAAYFSGDDNLFGDEDIRKNDRQSIYNGIRVLSDAEIDVLAANIVREIRRIGTAHGQPFLSMGEFVNRSLAEVAGEPATQLKGVLQLAIDDGPFAADTQESVLARLSGGSGEPDAEPALNYDIVRNDKLRNTGIGVNSEGLVQAARANSYPDGFLEMEPRSADAPAFLSQADILAALGPVLSVRSDTFIIRAYGDATGINGETLARAWCEVLVQRLPEPVVRKGSDPASADFYEPSADTAETLGRRFVVLGFRWLGPGET